MRDIDLRRIKKVIRHSKQVKSTGQEDKWATVRAQTEKWLDKGNVTGIGVGEQITDGMPTGERALRIYVNRKLPKTKVAKAQRLHTKLFHPGTGETIPVDVIETGRMVPHSLRGGSRITVNGQLGRIGCLVRKRNDTSRIFLLSNAHVLGFANTQSNGPIYGANGIVARFTQAIPLNGGPGYPNLVDAAIAEISSNQQIISSIWGIGSITGIMNGLLKGDVVQIGLEGAGRRAARTSDLYADLLIDYYGIGTLGFDNLVLCDRLSEPGDSGSIIVDLKQRIVGLLIGGSENGQFSFFCRIKPVFSMLDVEPIF